MGRGTGRHGAAVVNRVCTSGPVDQQQTSAVQCSAVVLGVYFDNGPTCIRLSPAFRTASPWLLRSGNGFRAALAVAVITIKSESRSANGPSTASMLTVWTYLWGACAWVRGCAWVRVGAWVRGCAWVGACVRGGGGGGGGGFTKAPQNLHGKRIAANARWLEQIGDEKWKGTDTSTSTSTSTRTRSCIGNVLAMPV